MNDEEKMFLQTLGEKLATIRKAKGYTQKNIAIYLKITFQQVQKYEMGHNAISLYRLLKLCDLFHVSPSSFFDDEHNYLMLLNPLALEIIGQTEKLNDDILRSILHLMKTLQGDKQYNCM